MGAFQRREIVPLVSTLPQVQTCVAEEANAPQALATVRDKSPIGNGRETRR